MIPSVLTRINQANHEGGESDHDSHHRVSIPPEEITELSEVRRREHDQRAREQLIIETARMGEDTERANEVDQERPYGLPNGEAYNDIWEHILSHIHDPEDITPISQTCKLFRGILKQKYKTVRLAEVALLICEKNAEGDLDDFFTLRRVSRKSKEVIDRIKVI